MVEEKTQTEGIELQQLRRKVTAGLKALEAEASRIGEGADWVQEYVDGIRADRVDWPKSEEPKDSEAEDPPAEGPPQ